MLIQFGVIPFILHFLLYQIAAFTVHLPVSAACALYDAPEDGCVLHPKHVEQKKFNKITLNNLHQAGPNKPTITKLLAQDIQKFCRYKNNNLRS